jgi:hypothetical protein
MTPDMPSAKAPMATPEAGVLPKNATGQFLRLKFYRFALQ